MYRYILTGKNRQNFSFYVIISKMAHPSATVTKNMEFSTRPIETGLDFPRISISLLQFENIENLEHIQLSKCMKNAREIAQRTKFSLQKTDRAENFLETSVFQTNKAEIWFFKR